MTDHIFEHGSVAAATEAAMRAFEREQRKLVELHQKMEESTTEVRSKDRSLSMTFDGRGDLIGVKFQGNKFRSMAPAELAHVIVETVQAGRAQFLESMRESMSDGGTVNTVGGVDFSELLSGKADPTKILGSLLPSMFGEAGGFFDGAQVDSQKKAGE